MTCGNLSVDPSATIYRIRTLSAQPFLRYRKWVCTEDGIPLAREIARPQPPRLFLWGFLRGRVYRAQSQTFRELKDSISEVLATITPKLCLQLIARLRRRLQLCDQLGGRHFEQLL